MNFTFEFSNIKNNFSTNLKLEDNGIYTCKYNQIVKRINAIIYSNFILLKI